MPVFNNYQINGANPVTVGGLGVTPKYFPAPSGNFTAGPATTPNATNATGQLAIHGDNTLNGQRFSIEASGNFEVGAGGACPSVRFDLQANTGTLVVPIYTTIATSGAITAQTLTGQFYPWSMVVNLTGDTQSGTISGTQTWVVDNTVSASNGALTSVLAGLNFNPTQQVPAVNGQPNAPVFGLVMRVTFSVSEPGNSANMFLFQTTGQ
jgi:hypothetical protein